MKKICCNCFSNRINDHGRPLPPIISQPEKVLSVGLIIIRILSESQKQGRSNG